MHRVLRANRVKPHQVRTFKASRDPQLVAKVCDIVGLYLDPPRGRACGLRRSRRPRSRPSTARSRRLPLRPGLAERRTHDYVRHGTTNLYAALEIASGQVVGQCRPRHRRPGVPRLPAPPRGLSSPAGELHIVLDNSSTHSTPGGQALAGPPQARDLPLHAHGRQLDEPRRVLVQHPHPQADPPRHLRQRAAAHRRHQTLHRRRTTSTPSPSSGRRAPSRSWPRRLGKRLRERNTRVLHQSRARGKRPRHRGAASAPFLKEAVVHSRDEKGQAQALRACACPFSSRLCTTELETGRGRGPPMSRTFASSSGLVENSSVPFPKSLAESPSPGSARHSWSRRTAGRSGCALR